MTADCHACHREGTAACRATFVCRKCGRERNVCAFLPGGFEAFTGVVEMGPRECVLCEEARIIGEKWVTRWHKKKAG